MEKKLHPRRLALGVLFFAALAWPAAAQPETRSLSILAELLKFAAARAEPVLREVAVPMALSLATIEIVVYALKKPTQFPLQRLGVRLAIIVFFLAAAANNTPVLSVRQIVHGAEEIAGVLAGVQGMSPSRIVDQGLYLFGLMMKNLTDFGLLWSDSGDVLTHYVAAFGTLFAYTLVALQVTLTLVQGSYLLAVSPIFMAFGASRWTIVATEGYVNVVLWWSIKLIVLALTLSIGNLLAANVEVGLRFVGEAGFPAFSKNGSDWQIVTLTVGYALAAAFIPGMLSSKLNVQIRISQLLGD
jgi:type IV secretory pathway TrbL component